MTSTAPTAASIDDIKAALRRKDTVAAQAMIDATPEPHPIGVRFLAIRAALDAGDLDRAEARAAAFLAEAPRHGGGHLMAMRIALAKGDLGGAAAAGARAREVGADAANLSRLEQDLAAREGALEAARLIEVIDAGHIAARESAPSPEMEAAARRLAELPLGPRWTSEPLQAKIAFFHHAADPVAALRNYDAHLIEVSTEFDYIHWPKRIQDMVRGKSVIDVGCGFGGYGMGFLVAGATDYFGLDPVMALDSTRAKNKRTRQWADMGVTPREIAATLPDIRLLEGISEDLSLDETFDTISLHNVTEHLIQLDLVFEGLVKLCKPTTNIVFLHHNFYCWNGHHFAPNRPDQLDLDDPGHREVYDWRHIDFSADLPDDHYFKTHLNRVRLDEIRAITERHFDVDVWTEIPSSPETLSRLTPDILDRVRRTIPDLTERDLSCNAVFCIAAPKS